MKWKNIPGGKCALSSTHLEKLNAFLPYLAIHSALKELETKNHSLQESDLAVRTLLSSASEKFLKRFFTADTQHA